MLRARLSASGFVPLGGGSGVGINHRRGSSPVTVNRPVSVFMR
jgi:hypothetical protein